MLQQRTEDGLARIVVVMWLGLGLAANVLADTGDPQIRTDHPWYPGELAISSFERLFATQAEVYRRTTGLEVDSDEDKVLASWLWRNTHFWHGEAGRRDLWGDGFQSARDMRLREYWNGLFAYGFGLCGTTHSQWTAEMERLLGHGRSRGLGAAAHNSFEVFLRGGAYGTEGRWALLDHDLSTVVFDESGHRLMGLGELQSNLDHWLNRDFNPGRQCGWLICGLRPGDGSSFARYAVSECLAGYAGPPPMVHLRRGERMRRYFQPGMEDGSTFVFWGRNYNTGDIPGPERARTWVNQPDQMYQSKDSTPHRDGQVRFANVEYVYRPDFTSGDYREGVITEGTDHVIFGFQSPYVIAATPPSDDAWGIYELGCRNGLVIRGTADCDVSVSVDAGQTWTGTRSLRKGVADRGFVGEGADLTDHVKGRSQYWIRFSTGARQLADSGLEVRTVCQANVAVLPRLKDNGTTIRFQASGNRVRSLGPESDLAKRYVTAGSFGEPKVTLSVSPRDGVVGIHAAAHTASGAPPDSDVRYSIEYSLDDGAMWRPVVTNWSDPTMGDQPGDFWSQSFCYGSCSLELEKPETIQIRFRNDGGKRYLRAEAHLVEFAGEPDPTTVTFRWIDADGLHQKSHRFVTDGSWHLGTGEQVRTQWVQFEPSPN